MAYVREVLSLRGGASIFLISVQFVPRLSRKCQLERGQQQRETNA